MMSHARKQQRLHDFLIKMKTKAFPIPNLDNEKKKKKKDKCKQESQKNSLQK
jgi:hypothetical protein